MIHDPARNYSYSTAPQGSGAPIKLTRFYSSISPDARRERVRAPGEPALEEHDAAHG